MDIRDILSNYDFPEGRHHQKNLPKRLRSHDINCLNLLKPNVPKTIIHNKPFFNNNGKILIRLQLLNNLNITRNFKNSMWILKS